jgi:hypothetical protein
VRARAKLPGLRMHELRRSFASFAVANGASLFLVGKALGHSQATTTEGYAHLADDPVRAVSEAVAQQGLGERRSRPEPRGEGEAQAASIGSLSGR